MIDGKRCLGYHCPDDCRSNCAHHLRPVARGDVVFQSQEVGEKCGNFKPF